MVGTVGRNGSSSVDVVGGGGGGEATENVGASDQVLVDAWAKGSYVPQPQSKKDRIMPNICSVALRYLK